VKNNFQSILLAYLFVAVLSVPSITQWEHLVTTHKDESVCTDGSIHFHKKEIECALDYTFTSPYVSQTSSVFIPKKTFYYTLTGHYSAPYQSLSNYHYSLRGPPIVLL